jgi:hypothetical protein
LGRYRIAYPVYKGAQYDASTTNLSYVLPAPSYANESIEITLSFLSPITPDSTVRQAIPASYFTIFVSGPVDVDIYTDVNGQWVSGDRGKSVIWGLDDHHLDGKHALKSLYMRREHEEVLKEIEDRGEWGTLYFTGPAHVRHEVGTSAELRQRFSRTGTLQNEIDSHFRGIMDEEPVLAFSEKFRANETRNGNSQSITFTFAHLRDPVARFASARGPTLMRPLWKSYFPSNAEVLTFHYFDFQHASTLASLYSDRLADDAYKSGSDDYRDIVAVSARQVLGAVEFSGTPDDPILFLKEISSNGDFQTIDVIFPAFPFFLYTQPKWLAYLLEPLIEHMLSGQYPNTYAMHDLGVFPTADGHPDGNDEYMPVEECGNILIMGLALANAMRDDTHLAPANFQTVSVPTNLQYEPQQEGIISLNVGDSGDMQFIDAPWRGGELGKKQASQWISRSYKLWKQWTGYLVNYSLRPENQLSTDDFAGWLELQTNLALKGIIGIKAMAGLAEMIDEDVDVKIYTNISSTYIKKWEEYGISRDGTHAKLSYNWYGSWTILYNLYADSLLCFHLSDGKSDGKTERGWTDNTPALVVNGDKQKPLKPGPSPIKGDHDGFVPKHIYQMQSDWYYTVRQKYGVPLDSRHRYTKTDWEFFAMAVTAPRVRAEILQSKALWVNETASTDPLTDLHWTNGDGGSFQRFMARPVIGGHFAFLTLERACDGRAMDGLKFLNDTIVDTLGKQDFEHELATDQHFDCKLDPPKNDPHEEL